MLFSIIKLIQIVKYTNISSLILLSNLILLNSLFELLSIGILIPLISIIIDPELYTNLKKFFENKFILFFLDVQNFDKNSFILFFLSVTSILFILKFFVNTLYSWFLNSIKTNNENVLSIKILKNFSSTSNLHLLSVPISKLIYDINTRTGIVSSSIINVSNLLVELIILLIIYFFLLYKFPQQSLVLLLIILPFMSFFYYVWRNRIIRWSSIRGETGEKKNKILLDFFGGIREITVYSAHRYFIKEFTIINKLFLSPQRKILFLNSLPKIVLEIIFLALIIIYFFYNVLNGFDFQSKIVNFSIVLVLFLRLFPSLNRVIFNFNQFKFCTDSIFKVHELIKLSSEIKENDKHYNINNSISLKNIHFNFLDKENIFEDLNLTIPKNSKVGLIGVTGSGKSTLIDILIGFIKPKKGSVLIDQKNVSKIKNFLSNISYVPQQICLFNDSIRNNICFKNDDEEIDQERFEKTINIADLKDLIKSLPKKEFSEVGEKGCKLSGGQRQRVGIARALYKNSSLLIFDESTNALDEDSEKKIIDNILALKNKTIIFITHNINNLKKFDKVLEIKDKQIIEKKINV